MADDSVASPFQAKDSRPVPDPTFLTTSALHREIERQEKSFAERLAALEKQHDIKFDGIEKRFEDRDKTAIATAESIKSAVDKAFESAKEAAAERQENTQKLLDAQGRELGDVKDRVVRIESRGEGSGSAIHWVISGVMFLLAAAGAFAAFSTKIGSVTP